MPQVYRRHPEHNPRPSLVPRRRSTIASSGPQPTDADDSIVLADLVRSGEASRLRRRGAMRLDHGTTTGARVPPARPIVVEPLRTPSPEPAADGGVPPDEYTYSAAPAWREWDGPPPGGRAEGRGAEGVQAVEIMGEGSQAGQAYTLYCGGEDAGLGSGEEERLGRFEPSPLPGFPSSLSSGSTRAQGKAPRRTNGCGAVVHVQAYPQRPRGAWMAKKDAAEAVVAMDPAYCDHPAMDKMLKSACGCVREGIGCSVCGNTLGTRYVPCQAASESIFSPTPTGSMPPPPSTSYRPSGPNYWNARPTPSHCRSSSSMSSRGPSSYYTFFADRVTATPVHESLRRHVPAPVLVEPRRSVTRPASPERDYGYRWTASPQPVSTELPPLPLSPQITLPILPPLRRNSSQLRPALSSSREAQPPLSVNTNGPVPELDADGVPLDEVDEPSSPDKEGMSWPGR